MVPSHTCWLEKQTQQPDEASHSPLLRPRGLRVSLPSLCRPFWTAVVMRCAPLTLGRRLLSLPSLQPGMATQHALRNCWASPAASLRLAPRRFARHVHEPQQRVGIWTWRGGWRRVIRRPCRIPPPWLPPGQHPQCCTSGSPRARSLCRPHAPAAEAQARAPRRTGRARPPPLLAMPRRRLGRPWPQAEQTQPMASCAAVAILWPTASGQRLHPRLPRPWPCCSRI
mmetsp:Transcript_169729/g.544711  ORF Transcript_169729/g.544711 Transcript_169729/m.544711 type:complete len:226 (-) Transcript_169729:728-1405(-)